MNENARVFLVIHYSTSKKKKTPLLIKTTPLLHPYVHTQTHTQEYIWIEILHQVIRIEKYLGINEFPDLSIALVC